MQLADVINFEFYFAEMEKLGFQKIISNFFDGTFNNFFWKVLKWDDRNSASKLVRWLWF